MLYTHHHTHTIVPHCEPLYSGDFGTLRHRQQSLLESILGGTLWLAFQFWASGLATDRMLPESSYRAHGQPDTPAHAASGPEHTAPNHSNQFTERDSIRISNNIVYTFWLWSTVWCFWTIALSFPNRFNPGNSLSPKRLLVCAFIVAAIQWTEFAEWRSSFCSYKQWWWKLLPNFQ